jgi:hypothetical protein
VHGDFLLVGYVLGGSRPPVLTPQRIPARLVDDRIGLKNGIW